MSASCIMAHIKSKQMLEEEYGGPLVDLQYYSLVSAIPKEWKDKIKQKETFKFEQVDKYFAISHLKMNMEKLKK